MWTYNYSNELYHYGVPGMKWGVRRALKKSATRTQKSMNELRYDRNTAGENVKAVAKKYEQSVKELNKEDRRALLERAKEHDAALDEYNKTIDPKTKRGDPSLAAKFENIDAKYVDDLISLSFKNLKIAENFVDDFNAAYVKDLGISNAEAGVKYLKKKGLHIKGWQIANSFTPDILFDEFN